MDRSLLEEQLRYYRARAPEYEDWYWRRGRYDRGPEHRAEWRAGIDQLKATLQQEIQGQDILELACGTGAWTAELAGADRRVLAMDGSPEAIALNRAQLPPGARVEFQVADLFAWQPGERFDFVFFAFWLSHVPADAFEEFWRQVARALKPGGSVFFMDSLLEPASTAVDQALNRSGVVRRKLNDGREFRVVKIFYDPAELEARLAALGWEGWVHAAGRFFLCGRLRRRATGQQC